MAASIPVRPAPDPAAPLGVVVMGVSGSGKSTLGTRLAEALGAGFVEGDRCHDAAAIASMRAGLALTDADRWPWLDRVGAAMRRVIDERGRAVAACSALKHGYRTRLAAAAGQPLRFVLLDGGYDALRARLELRQDHYMPPSLLASQLATLERPGMEEAALVIDAAVPSEVACRQVIAWLAAAA